MDSLVGYGSDEEVESERFGPAQSSVGGSGAGGSRRRDDDTNYDDVNMDMSEDSQAESEPELPQAEPGPSIPLPEDTRDKRNRSDFSRDRDSDHARSRDSDGGRGRSRDNDNGRGRSRDSERGRSRDSDRRERRRDSPRRGDRDRRSPRKDDRHRDERDRSRYDGPPRRGLLGDKPDDKRNDSKVPALMDLKPFPDGPSSHDARRSHDARDAVSPRFVERDRRDRDRERDRERHSRRSEEKRSSGYRPSERRERSRSRGAAFPPPTHGDRRGSPGGDYRPSSYKVNRKLEVMEKMGLQIKTPDGSMATAQQLRAAASEAPPGGGGVLPGYYNPGAVNASKIMDQVQKRKLLWSHKNKSEAEEAAKWSGTRFAQDSDGKQVSKFMRLMGIKDAAAVKSEADKAVDPIKKQEELFQAMQAQYEVARATTHTMRGVGLGFQRGQY